MLPRLSLLAALAGAAQAISVRSTNGCAFRLHTSGAVSLPVGQLSSGQTRAGSDLALASFSLANGGLTDSQSRGCWWTPPTQVLQCDVNQVPATGFSIGCDGAVSFNGQSVFWECKTGDGDEVNIYLSPSGSNCGKITLTADGCYSGSCGWQNTTIAVGPTTTTTPGGAGHSTSTTTVYVTQSASTVTVSVPGSTTTTTVAGSTTTVAESTTTVAGSTTTVAGSTTTVAGSTTTVAGYTTTVAGSTTTIESTVTVNVCSPGGGATATTTVPGSGATTTAPGSGETTTAPGSGVTTTAPGSGPSQTTYTTSTVTVTSCSGGICTPVTTTTVVPVGSTTLAPPSSTPFTTETITITQCSVGKCSAVSTITTSVPCSVYTTTITSCTDNKCGPVTITTTVPVAPISTPSFNMTSTAKYQNSTTVTIAPATTTSSKPASSCPGTLEGAWEYPHLILPVSSTNPDEAYANSYFASFNGSQSTIFNFDIPESYAGKTCKLVFYLPTPGQLETSSFTLSGQAGQSGLNFFQLGSVAQAGATWNSVHAGALTPIGSMTLAPGNAWTLDTFACPAGQAISFEGDSNGFDTDFTYFQDYNPCPMGLYVVPE